jgi:hypothetical protein
MYITFYIKNKPSTYKAVDSELEEKGESSRRKPAGLEVASNRTHQQSG